MSDRVPEALLWDFLRGAMMTKALKPVVVSPMLSAAEPWGVMVMSGAASAAEADSTEADATNTDILFRIMEISLSWGEEYVRE